MIEGARYVPDCPGLPDAMTPPALLARKEVERKLTIPSDVRQKFLGDPLRSAEWKKLLKSFEKLHGSTSAAPAPATPATPATKEPATSPAAEGADANPWKHIFEGEPRTLTDLVAKYGEPSSTNSAPGSSGFVIKIVEGPPSSSFVLQSLEHLIAMRVRFCHMEQAPGSLTAKLRRCCKTGPTRLMLQNLTPTGTCAFWRQGAI